MKQELHWITKRRTEFILSKSRQVSKRKEMTSFSGNCVALWQRAVVSVVRGMNREEFVSILLCYAPHFTGINHCLTFPWKNQQNSIFTGVRCWRQQLKLCLSVLNTHHPPYLIPKWCLCYINQEIMFLISFWIPL